MCRHNLLKFVDWEEAQLGGSDRRGSVEARCLVIVAHQGVFPENVARKKSLDKAAAAGELHLRAFWLDQDLRCFNRGLEIEGENSGHWLVVEVLGFWLLGPGPPAQSRCPSSVSLL